MSTSIEQIKAASKLVIFTDPMTVKKYFSVIGKEINSSKGIEIADEIIKRFDAKKVNENKFYGLHTFLNADIAKKLNITL